MCLLYPSLHLQRNHLLPLKSQNLKRYLLRLKSLELLLKFCMHYLALVINQQNPKSLSADHKISVTEEEILIIRVEIPIEMLKTGINRIVGRITKTGINRTEISLIRIGISRIKTRVLKTELRRIKTEASKTRPGIRLLSRMWLLTKINSKVLLKPSQQARLRRKLINRLQKSQDLKGNLVHSAAQLKQARIRRQL